MKFNVEELGGLIRAHCPEAVFVLLHGSAKEGVVKAGSDIDLACFVEGKVVWDFYRRMMDQAERLAPGVRCDVGVLNEADVVYRFEALKGKLLFARDQEAYLQFFSMTCRLYEDLMASLERQRRYRLEAKQS